MSARHQTPVLTKTDKEAQRWAAAELVDILNAYREDRVEFDKRSADKPFTILTIDQICDQAFVPTWKQRLEDVKTDPVRTVLRSRAREIGWKLYARGGLQMMESVCDLVDQATPGRPGGAILDKWWDGLGIHDKGGMWCA